MSGRREADRCWLDCCLNRRVRSAAPQWRTCEVVDTPVARPDVALGVGADQLVVVVVAGIRVYRDGLCQLLDASPAVTVVMSAAGVEEAVLLMRAARANAVIVDIASPGGLLAARRLVEVAAPVPVVGTGLGDGERDILDAAEAGLTGFVSADADVAELVAAVCSARRGDLLCTPRVAAILRRRIAALARDHASAETARLTTREREVMSLVDAGLSNRDVARRLSIEVSTVKNHIRSVFDKLDVSDRQAAISRLRLRDARHGP